MVETPQDPPTDLDEEFAEMAGDLDDIDEDVRGLIDALRDQEERSLRLAVRYSGDDIELLFVREDLNERYSGPELEERVDALVVKGLSDPPREESLYDFGRLDATVRWYDAVMVAHFPYREWSGLVFTFDRVESPLVDLVDEFLDG
jgi:hypothetical protein